MLHLWSTGCGPATSHGILFHLHNYPVRLWSGHQVQISLSWDLGPLPHPQECVPETIFVLSPEWPRLRVLGDYIRSEHVAQSCANQILLFENLEWGCHYQLSLTGVSSGRGRKGEEREEERGRGAGGRGRAREPGPESEPEPE